MGIMVNCNNIEIRLNEDLGTFTPTLTCEEGEVAGLYYVTLELAADEAAQLPTLTLSWDLPSIDFHHKWNSQCMQVRALDPSTGSFNRVDSSANSGMPVYSLYNLDGINACTWALSDVIHDTRIGGAYRHGKVYQSDVTIVGATIGVVDAYAVTIRFDFRRIPYYAALRDVSKYWESLSGCAPCHVPEAARMPLLSSWYSYGLNIDPEDLEKQCALAKDMGMDTVILDDGWQTGQRTFGYQNNGDWEVSSEKLPDFAGHVRRVQALGMKYMVWFSVPFVGIESRAYQRFKDMLLPGKEGATHFSLDPRFKETRDYLATTYENFVRQYGIDGLKMDFIGSILDRNPSADRADDRRDFVSVGEAVCKLLEDVMVRLRKINPDILIEFRQDYTGPAMRRFANMFRAVDCPNSVGDNRVRSLDIRLLCGETAVHADPITWHDDEPDHSAAMQIIHALFAVPQISHKISNLSASHRRMLKHQMAFCREHRDVLQGGELRPLYPHLLYPLVVAKSADKLLAAYYSGLPLRLDEEIPESLILVNGSYNDELLLDLCRPMGTVQLTIADCCGEVVSMEEMELQAGLHRIAVPPAGHANIRRAMSYDQGDEAARV